MQTSVRDVVYVVFRHKWKIALVFLAVVLGVMAYSYLAPEIFRSEAKLLVRLGRENMAVDPSVSGPPMPVLTSRDGEVKSEIAILTSESLLEGMVDAMGLEAFTDPPSDKPATWHSGLVSSAGSVVGAVKDLAEGLAVKSGLRPELTEREKVVRRLVKGVDVEVEKQSSVLTVTLEQGHAALARDALDTLLGLYLERHIEVFASQASPKFFETQAAKLRAELAEKEQRLDAYRRENGVVTLAGESEKLLGHISNLENMLANTLSERRASEARVAELEKGLAAQSNVREISRTTGRPNFAADALKDRLADLRTAELDLSSRYPATHRPLIELRKQVAAVEAELAQEDETHTEVTTGVNTNFQELELALQTERAQLAASQAQWDVLAAELAEQKRQISLLAELNNLTRDAELAEQEYRRYRENLQRAKISAALDVDKVSNVSVVQSATLPRAPVRPRRLLNLGLGLVIGLFGGLTVAFLMEYLDDSLNTKEKAERCLGVPVLAVVSEKEYKACT
ncbi:MAG: hypothetical protein GWP08_11050 [Nitrospiraceae bacterium]|nr:hypothetical protein [Nitrospiraceae bacterium]